MPGSLTLAEIVLARWIRELSERTGRPEAMLRENGLNLDDFSDAGVLINFEDGSQVRFERAFILVRCGATVRLVAVFTEHCGYHEFRLFPDDELIAVSLKK